jgi:hypothetical protein
MADLEKGETLQQFAGIDGDFKRIHCYGAQQFEPMIFALTFNV